MSPSLSFPSTIAIPGASCAHNADSHQVQKSTQPEHESGKHTLSLPAPRLEIPSGQRSTTTLQTDEESLGSPIEPMSPVVFRRYDDDWSGSYLTRGSPSDSVFPCLSIQPGASSHHQSTSYNLLSPHRVPSPNPRTLYIHPPSRSSSLRSLHTRSAPMSRAPSPSPSESITTSDRCSERMVFAPKDPDEPDFESDSAPPTHTPPTSFSIPPIWYSWKSSRSNGSHDDVPPMKSVTSIRSDTSQKAPHPPFKTNSRATNEPSLEFYSPTIMTGLVSPCAGHSLAFGAPTPIVTSTKRSKTKPRSHSSASSSSTSTSTSGDSPREKSFKPPTFRRMRQLVARKSISSLDAVLNSVSSKSDPSRPLTSTTSTLTSNSDSTAASSAARSRTPSLNVDNFTDHLPAITVTPIDVDVDVDHSFSAHRNIHGVWKKQEISDVIPVLRSMRFGGK